MSNSYETALRICLRDYKAMVDNILDHGSIRYEHRGQWLVMQRDAELLLNREDCPNYDYKKDQKPCV